MRYEKGVLSDLITDLRTSQNILNSKPEITPEDFDQVVETLNKSEILTMSLLGTILLVDGAGLGVGNSSCMPHQTQIDEYSKLNAEELVAKLSAEGVAFQIVLPDEGSGEWGIDVGVGMGGSGGGSDGSFNGYPDEVIQEEDKYSSDDEPKNKS